MYLLQAPSRYILSSRLFIWGLASFSYKLDSPLYSISKPKQLIEWTQGINVIIHFVIYFYHSFFLLISQNQCYMEYLWDMTATIGARCRRSWHKVVFVEGGQCKLDNSRIFRPGRIMFCQMCIPRRDKHCGFPSLLCRWMGR